MALCELPDRIQSKIMPEPNSGCWLWIAALWRGYARLGWQNRSSCLAHRIIYELFNGPVPIGLELDHLCKTRACVNPAHLEPVTRAENQKRALSKMMCKRGHILIGHNLHLVKSPNRTTRRSCRQCESIRAKNYRQRKVIA